jgi:hypothetical protein
VRHYESAGNDSVAASWKAKTTDRKSKFFSCIAQIQLPGTNGTTLAQRLNQLLPFVGLWEDFSLGYHRIESPGCVTVSGSSTTLRIGLTLRRKWRTTSIRSTSAGPGFPAIIRKELRSQRSVHSREDTQSCQCKTLYISPRSLRVSKSLRRFKMKLRELRYCWPSYTTPDEYYHCDFSKRIRRS